MFFSFFKLFSENAARYFGLFLFIIETHGIQILTLTDYRWQESVIAGKRTLGNHAEVKIKARIVYESYFLIFRGTQDQVTAEYSSCLREKRAGTD